MLPGVVVVVHFVFFLFVFFLLFFCKLSAVGEAGCLP